jgi:NAD-dependent deacetylase
MGEKVARECDICFVVGTSAIVYPAAYIPITAQQYGAYIVEVNIEETELTSLADYSIIGKSGEILPQIIESVKNLKRNH